MTNISNISDCSFILFWPHHVDDQGVVCRVEAANSDASGKKHRQDKIEVGDERHQEAKRSRHKEAGTEESKFLPRNPRVLAEKTFFSEKGLTSDTPKDEAC